MKIRITKKGLPKAQMWNSQVGEELKSNNQPNNNWVNFTQPQVPMPRTTVVNTDGSKTTTGNFGEATTLYKTSTKGTPLDQGEIVPIGQNNNDFIGSMGAASMALKGAITAGNMITDYFGSRRKIQEAKSNQYRDNLNPEATEMFRGNYMTNSGVFQPDKLPTPNEGMLAYGGTADKSQAMKIRIVSAPDSMAYGGQTNYGLDLGAKRVHTDMPESKMDSVSNTIGPVPRSMANIEAEQGETIYGDLDGDGGMEHMNIGGKRHSKGGTPLNAPDGSFIFSDTKKMKIKDPMILKMFGGGTKSVTPAQLAKKYNINKYKAIMEDPNADQLSKSTAQLMVKNYESKLANLALVQESMKGFPQGIPQIAAKMMEPSEMAYGGYLPKAQNGKQQLGQVFTPDFQNLLAGLKKDKGYDLAYSPRILAGDNQIPMMQSRQKSGLYGDVQTNELDEFKKRHDWYFANNPNWNPANKANVADFQNKYEQEYAKKYGYSYFGGKRKFDRADGFLGEYTYNAPALRKAIEKTPAEPNTKYKCTPNGVQAVNVNSSLSSMMPGLFNSYAEAEAVCRKTEPSTPKEKIDPNKNTFTGNEKLPFGYMTPDVVNMFATAAVPPKIAMGFRPKAAFTDGNYSLEDWLSKAQQRQQVYNQSADAMGTFGPSSALASNLSFMAGQTGDGIASDIANVAGRNVDRANVAMSTERQRKDQNDLFNLAQSQELYKDNVIARQQYDNARRNYLGDISKSFSNAWNNRMNLGLVNATNPMYNINPLSGRSYFKKGYDTSKLGMMGSNPGSEDYWARMNEAYTAARTQFPDLTSEQFLREARATNTMTDRNGDGVADSSSVRRQMPFGGYITYPF
jgi:hypothetical protein